MGDSVDGILQDFRSIRHSDSEDIVDILNRLCALIIRKRGQIKLLFKYSSVLTLVDFLSLTELRTPSLNIIACACVDGEFVDAFIKHPGVQKLVLAIDDAWDHRQLNVACLALSRIFKRRIKYPQRHDAILAPLIPRTVDFLRIAREVEFQLTVCRFWMVLHDYPVSRNAIVEFGGPGILVQFLSSRNSELQLCAFRALLKLCDFSDHKNWDSDEKGWLLEMSFKKNHFSSFAYFCFIEESMLKDITEFLVYSNIVPKLFLHLSKSGSLDLKRLVLISIRHLMPRLSQLTYYQIELRDLFQYLKRILDCKVDQEFHVLIVRVLHDLSICTSTYKYFDNFNFMDNLLEILKAYIEDNKCPCTSNDDRKDARAIMPWLNNRTDEVQPQINRRYFPKSLPPLTAKYLRQMCFQFSTSFSGSESIEQASKQVLFACQTDLPDKALKNLDPTTGEDSDELFMFKCLMAEYTTTSRELENVTIDCYILDTILKFLQKREPSYPYYTSIHSCFARKIVCHYEVLIDYAFFNPSHYSRTVLDIISILVSDQKSLLQLILNEFILKLESYYPNGFRTAYVFLVESLDESSETHYTSIIKLAHQVQEALNTNASFLLWRNRDSTEEKLLVLQAASVLVSNKAILRTMLLDGEGLKFLIDCLSGQNTKNQKVAALAVNELYKFFTYLEPNFLTVSSDQIFRNWYPHSELSPCCSYLSKRRDSCFSKAQKKDFVDAESLGCRYSEAVHDVEFYANDYVGANREMICARSEYFKSLLLGNFKENRSSTIYLQNITKRSLTFIFHFLHGCTEDSSCGYQSNLGLLEKLDLLINCDYFLLSDLKVIVEKLLFDNLCCKNIPVIYEYSKTHNSPTLAVKAVCEALRIRHHADYWSCFQELVSLDPEFSFLADVENLLLQRLQNDE